MLNPMLVDTDDVLDDARSPFVGTGWPRVVDATGENADQNIPGNDETRCLGFAVPEEKGRGNVQKSMDRAPVVPPGLLSISFRCLETTFGHPEEEEGQTDEEQRMFEQLTEFAREQEPCDE